MNICINKYEYLKITIRVKEKIEKFVYQFGLTILGR